MHFHQELKLYIEKKGRLLEWVLVFLYLFLGFFFSWKKKQKKQEPVWGRWLHWGLLSEWSHWRWRKTEFHTRTLWASSLLWKRGNFSTRVRVLNVVLKVLLTNITVLSFINTHLVCITHIYDVFPLYLLKDNFRADYLKFASKTALSSWRWLRGWRGLEGGGRPRNFLLLWEII